MKEVPHFVHDTPVNHTLSHIFRLLLFLGEPQAIISSADNNESSLDAQPLSQVFHIIAARLAASLSHHKEYGSFQLKQRVASLTTQSSQC